jgi:hypothetical protein
MFLFPLVWWFKILVVQQESLVAYIFFLLTTIIQVFIMKPTTSKIHTNTKVGNTSQKLLVLLITRILYCYISVVVTNHDTLNGIIYTNAFTTTSYPYQAQKLRSNDFTKKLFEPVRNPATTSLQLLSKSTSATIAVCKTNSIQAKIRHLLPFDHQQHHRDTSKSHTSTTTLQNSILPIVASTSSSSSIFGVALISAISGGIFSGGLHAIAGTCLCAILLLAMYHQILALIYIHFLSR